MGPVTVKAELSSSPCIPMQPIPDTAPTNITEGPKRVLNLAIGNRRERGRCPRYWGIVLGLSEGAIYARRPPKGIDERSNDLEGDRGGSKDREGPRRSSKVVEGPRRVVEGIRDVRTGSYVVGEGCRGWRRKWEFGCRARGVVEQCGDDRACRPLTATVQPDRRLYL